MTTRLMRSSIALAFVALGVTVSAQTPLPAEQRIAAASKSVAANPGKPDGYNELALAFARRARETSDNAYYVKAEEAIVKALALSPDNYESLKMRTWVLLGQHEFAR